MHLVRDVDAIERVVHWNPQRPCQHGRLAQRLLRNKLVNNFGDLLGPAIVGREVARRQLSGPMSRRLLAVGSILHFAEDDDVVWGAGVNGKMTNERHQFLSAGTCARYEARERDSSCAPEASTRLRSTGTQAFWCRTPSQRCVRWRERTKHKVTVIPNLNEVTAWSGVDGFLDPAHQVDVLPSTHSHRDALVVGSSLHGIVVAESLGIPARLITPNAESLLKYTDYYEGHWPIRVSPYLGRSRRRLRLGGEKAPCWSPEPLLEAFPEDLWR